jgi:hypothetical protein
MAQSDEKFVAAALRYAKAMGYPDGLDASIVERGAEVRVFLSNPAYVRGGGLTVVIDTKTGFVTGAVRAL